MEKQLQLLRNRRTKVIWGFLLLFGLPTVLLVNSCDEAAMKQAGNIYEAKMPYNLQDSIPYNSSPTRFTRFISPMGDDIEMQSVIFDGCEYVITTRPDSRRTMFVLHSPKCPNHESDN